MSTRRRCGAAPTILALIAAGTSTVAAQPADPWAVWRPLLGEWVAEGGGTPGTGSGALSFALDLQDRVLVRRNRVDYPATTARAAFRHEDLIVHYRDGDRMRATYFDSEAHVIRYLCTAATDAWSCDSEGPGPLFRLTYRLEGNALRISFAMAASGQPGDLAVYASGVAHRKGAASP